MRLVHANSSGLTTLQGENAVSPCKFFRTNNVTGRKCSSSMQILPDKQHYRARMRLVQQKSTGLTTFQAENAVSPVENGDKTAQKREL